MRNDRVTTIALWVLLYSLSVAVATAEEPASVIKRIPQLEMYPCNDCHSSDADYNAMSRELTEEHTDILLHHGEEENLRWCQSCHLEGRYNKLTLQNGREIGFNQAHIQCGSCHGPELDDWEKNIHGKRIGGWRGGQETYSCPACHDPHDPPFKALKPEPPPTLPAGKDKSLLELIFGGRSHGPETKK